MNALIIAVSFLIGNTPPPLIMPVKQEYRIQTKNPILLIRYTADWCGSCKAQNSMLNQLFDEGYPMTHIDVDDAKWTGLIKRYPWRSLPYWIMVVDNKAWQVRKGTVSRKVLKEWYREAGFRDPKPRGKKKQVFLVRQPVRYQQPTYRIPPTVPYPRCNNPGCAMCYGRRW